MFDHALRVSSLLKLHPCANTLESLEVMVAKGLPSSCVDFLSMSLFSNKEEARAIKAKVAPELDSTELLTVATSERVERLARTFALATVVWDSEEDARAFLNNRHPLLKGRTPLDVAMTELGAIRVSQLLHQLYFGVLPHIPK